MNGLIHRIHAECGQVEDSENINITIDLLVKDLKTYNKNISFQEIELAFRNGIKNEYGDWYGLNNKTYFGWINGFTMSVKRQETIKKRDELSIVKPVELTEEEKKKIIHEGCLLVFEEFKAKGHVVDMGNVNYNYLDSMGVFTWAKGRKFDFIRQAQEVLRAESQNSLEATKDVFERKKIREGLEEINSAQSTKVIARAKRIALNTYFKDLVEMGIELKEQLK